MGELIGIVVGSYIWIRVWAWLLKRLGVSRVRAVWGGYLLTIVAGFAISQYTGFSEFALIGYAVCGLMWAGWLSQEAPPATSPARGISRSTEQARRQKAIDQGSDGRARCVCRSCSRENDGDAQYCEECGASLRAPACAACGTFSSDGAKFCKRCGAKLVSPASQPSNHGRLGDPPREPTTVAAGDRSAFICFDCGAEVRFGASHCQDCGLAFQYQGGTVLRA
jgi:hypothetical protein